MNKPESADLRGFRSDWDEVRAAGHKSGTRNWEAARRSVKKKATKARRHLGKQAVWLSPD